MKPEELEQIYAAYCREVYLYALSLCADAYEAEELTSDTFFKALLLLDETSDTVKFWLFKVCRNLFFDRVRRRKKHPAAPLETSGAVVEDTAWEYLLKREEARQLYRCIMKLPERPREIVLMFYVMNYSIREIAELTKRPAGAVKTALCRARIRLKILMEEERK